MTDNEQLAENLHLLLNRKKRELEILRQVSSEINKNLDVDQVATTILQAMADNFGFEHSMILLLEEHSNSLVVLATYGYDGYSGIGAKTPVGLGVIGMVAKRKKIVRMSNMGMQRTYMQAIREEVIKEDQTQLEDKVSLPGLTDVESQVAIPMLIENRLIGVFSVESREKNIFDKSDELLIDILAHQAAIAL